MLLLLIYSIIAATTATITTNNNDIKLVNTVVRMCILDVKLAGAYVYKSWFCARIQH